MQFEDFDKKIKEAAENHHPAYDEQAWAKMNKLLDKHMPEKEDRRRRFAWLFFLLFLLGGAGVFYGVQSLVSTHPAVPVASSDVKRSELSNEKNAEPGFKEETGKSNTVQPSGMDSEPTASVSQPGQPGINLPVAGKVGPLNAKVNRKDRHTPELSKTGTLQSRTVTKEVRVPSSQNAVLSPVFQSGLAKKKKKTVVKPDAVAGNDIQVNTPDKVADLITDQTVQNKLSPVPDPVTIQANADQVKASTIPVNTVVMQQTDTAISKLASTDVAAIPAKKLSPKKQSRFFLTFSAGPDASFTKEGKPGRIIPVTGAGIGYIYRERFSIRAGFYNATKVYTASPEAYNAPANFYAYYPYLVKVDANCRVYEIPVSFGYHFGARKNHSWFASASLSSYLMKRETYNYSYKTSAWGSVQQREWTFNNRNQHLFSVLGLSGGYQRKITDRISFIAEPYLRLPLQGVGYGKVKLNSAGVLFSIAVQPAALIPGKQKK